MLGINYLPLKSSVGESTEYKSLGMSRSLLNESEKIQSSVIDWLRFPLAVSVVFIHSFGVPSDIDVSLIDWNNLSSMDLYNLIRICFSHVLTHIAVPTFFLVSGFLFFYKSKVFNRIVYVQKMKKRFHSLFIPYVLWNLAAIMITVGLKIGAYFIKGKPLSNIIVYFEEKGWWRMFWDCNVWAEDRLNWLGYNCPMSGPINLPLWFLRDLIVISILTPFVYWFVKRFRIYGVLLLGLFYVSGVWFPISGFTVTTVFFFSLGAYFSIFGKNVVEELKRFKIVAYLLAFVLLFVVIAFDGRNTSFGNIMYPFYVVFGVISAINIAAFLIEKNKVKVTPLLSNSSFFIYATHTLLILSVSSLVVSKIATGDGVLSLTIKYFATPLLAVVICLGIFAFMKRFFPSLLRVFMGNR